MKARLVYFVDGMAVELESMDFEALDELTYAAFGSEEDIIESPRYYDKLKGLPKNGQVKVAFSGFDIPVRAVDYYAELGNNPFDGEQTMSVLVGNRRIGPSKRSIRENIARTLCDEAVVREFHDTFKHRYTPREEFLFCIGMLLENDKDVFEGVKRILDEATAGYEGYFVGRAFLDGLGRFESVKNKDEKGVLYSPKLVKKN